MRLRNIPKPIIFKALFAVSVLFIISVSAYTAPSFSSVSLVLNGSYTAPAFNSVSLVLGDAVDSCTYSSGNWEVECSDNCVITSDVNLGGNDLILSGAGSLNLQANITRFGNLDFVDSNDICDLIIDDGASLSS